MSRAEQEDNICEGAVKFKWNFIRCLYVQLFIN